MKTAISQSTSGTDLREVFDQVTPVVVSVGWGQFS